MDTTHENPDPGFSPDKSSGGLGRLMRAFGLDGSGESSPRAERRVMLALLVLSIAVNVVYQWFHSSSDTLTTDQHEHFDGAYNIVHGIGYALVPQGALDEVPVLTAYRAPGPALIMALGMFVFGASVTTARIVTLLVASTAAPLVYRFARTAMDLRVSLFAGVACAVYPPWLFHANNILSEPYFVPVLLLALTQSVLAVTRKTLNSGLLAGASLGLCTLVKPVAFPLTGLVGLYFCYTLIRARTPGMLRLLVALGTGYVITYSPWVIRNEIVFHRFIPFATEGGETLLGANNPIVAETPSLSGMWIAPVNVPEYAHQLENVRDDVERSRIQNQIAMAYLSSHPNVIPRLVFQKEVRFLTPITDRGGAARMVVLFSYGGLLLLIAGGVGHVRDTQVPCPRPRAPVALYHARHYRRLLGEPDARTHSHRGNVPSLGGARNHGPSRPHDQGVPRRRRSAPRPSVRPVRHRSRSRSRSPPGSSLTRLAPDAPNPSARERFVLASLFVFLRLCVEIDPRPSPNEPHNWKLVLVGRSKETQRRQDAKAQKDSLESSSSRTT